MANCDNSPLRYPIPAASAQKPHCTELLEKRSRFLTQSCQCGNAEKAKEFLAEIRLRNPDATHNCWAYVAGAPGDTARVGSSDDGEPHGTAGRPMLKVLLHSGIGEICVVVSRWFGGIKLGTGGLVRAYQDSVATNLQTLPTRERRTEEYLRIEIDYNALNAMKRLFSKYEGSIIEEDYQSMVSMRVSFPKDQLESFRMEAINATNGGVIIEKSGE